MNAISLGSKAFIQGAEMFGIGVDLNIGYPMNTSQISNSGLSDNDILLADSGYGQGQVMVTTLNMALAYSMLSNNGNIMNPRYNLEPFLFLGKPVYMFLGLYFLVLNLYDLRI